MIIFHFRVSVCFIIDWRFLSWGMSCYSNIHFVIYDIFRMLRSTGMVHHCTLCNIIHFQCTKWEETETLTQDFVVSKLCPLVESTQTSRLSYNSNICHLQKVQICYFNTNIRTGGPWASSLNWAIMCNNWSCYLAFLWPRG